MKIITAIGNPELSKKIENEIEIEIIGNDIQYQEGIFEILEIEKQIDFIIISELLMGNLSIEQLISKIKEKNEKIKIIIILEETKRELEEKLKIIGVDKILYHNQITVEEFIKILKGSEENYKEELENEIKMLREIILKNNIVVEKENKKQCKIISILGTGGIGKSVITVNLSKILKEKYNKILIVDFDILNNSLHTILGVEKYPQEIKKKLKNNTIINSKINIKELIIRINNQIDLVSGINLIFDSKYKISSTKINEIIEEIKINYDYIIIDTSSECFFDYTKNIIEKSDNCLFLLEANLTEINKAKNLIKIYKDEWKIEKQKIKIIINKYNENAIEENVIKNIFNEFKFLGKINFSKKYNIFINNKYNILDNNQIKNDYKKICKNL